MTLPAPYPPLVSGGEGLDRYPSEPSALAARMAAVYAVPANQVLPIRGLTHGLELVWRLAVREGGSVEAPSAEVPVMKMFQPPWAGGSFLVRRETTVPQSIAWTSSLRKPAFRICWIITRLAGLM